MITIQIEIDENTYAKLENAFACCYGCYCQEPVMQNVTTTDKNGKTTTTQVQTGMAQVFHPTDAEKAQFVKDRIATFLNEVYNFYLTTTKTQTQDTTTLNITIN